MLGYTFYLDAIGHNLTILGPSQPFYTLGSKGPFLGVANTQFWICAQASARHSVFGGEKANQPYYQMPAWCPQSVYP